MILIQSEFGIVIQDGKLYPIPSHIPDPPLEKFRAVSQLLRVSQSEGRPISAEERSLADRYAAEGIEAVAGAGVIADGHAQVRVTDRSVAFFDEDGGFFCGSTGRPIPFPPRRTTELAEL
ncbi:MAG TPA: hypothetical protein VGH98_18315 [Gemmatimonadaceae bacterium]